MDQCELDEVATTPTSIAIDVLDYEDYTEIMYISDTLDANFQLSVYYLGVSHLKYETLEQKHEEQ